MGTTQAQVLRMFLLQGAVVGALGSVGGVLLAAVLVQLFTFFARDAAGGALFEIHLSGADALSAALTATVCGVLAAVIPARSAARLDPAQAITDVSHGPGKPLPPTPLLQLQAVRKSYNVGLPSEAEVLHGVDLRLDAGEFVALVGPSGSGKSTLLNILGLLERMSSGSYQLEGRETHALDDSGLTLLRRERLGFVFQFHHLLPAFTALENVTLPALMAQGVVTAQDRGPGDRIAPGRGAGQSPAPKTGGTVGRHAAAGGHCPGAGAAAPPGAGR